MNHKEVRPDGREVLADGRVRFLALDAYNEPIAITILEADWTILGVDSLRAIP